MPLYLIVSNIYLSENFCHVFVIIHDTESKGRQLGCRNFRTHLFQIAFIHIGLEENLISEKHKTNGVLLFFVRSVDTNNINNPLENDIVFSNPKD